jgi:hypothetical protein
LGGESFVIGFGLWRELQRMFPHYARHASMFQPGCGVPLRQGKRAPGA